MRAATRCFVPCKFDLPWLSPAIAFTRLVFQRTPACCNTRVGVAGAQGKDGRRLFHLRGRGTPNEAVAAGVTAPMQLREPKQNSTIKLKQAAATTLQNGNTNKCEKGMSAVSD